MRKPPVDSARYRGTADLKGLHIAIAPPAMTSPNAINLDLVLQPHGLSLEDPVLSGPPRVGQD